MVLFDFPHTTVDYLHRVGRTGRVSSVAKCKASILMTHRNDVRIAWKIKVYKYVIRVIRLIYSDHYG